jgi:hypothetical protein
VAIFTMHQRKEERVSVRFCADLRKRARETGRAVRGPNVEPYGAVAMASRFKTDRTSAGDGEHRETHNY